MTKTRKIRPSDVVIWRPAGKDSPLGEHTAYRLHKLSSDEPFLDVTDMRYGASAPKPSTRWFAKIRWEGRRDDVLSFIDPDDDHWTLVTQGDDVGGRRYRYRLTYTEAQEIALAWLDRRFRVAQPDDEVAA